MKADLKHKLALLPLFAYSALTCAAEPALLGAQDMDRITAGAPQVLEQLVSMFKAAQGGGSSIRLTELTPLFTADQLAMISQKLASGEPEAGALPELTHNEGVTTYTLQPGETLKVKQASSNGVNYLYVYSGGNSTVTMPQHSL
ncbi:MAG TPA: hypothetical protein VF427_03070 [Noviherbaspirillum sp.]